MPVVTKATSYFLKGTPLQYTLTKADLAAIPSVAGDAYYSDQANWSQVGVKMRSTTGNQNLYILFPAVDVTPLGYLSSSTQALNSFEVEHMIIYDFDGGAFKVNRAELTAAEFDVAKNDIPVAQSVALSGTEVVGQVLTANYTYFDADADAEGTTTFQWYVSDDGAGLNRSAIGGEVTSTYTLVGGDIGKFIDCDVTPVAVTGPSPGLTVSTGFSGAIA